MTRPFVVNKNHLIIKPDGVYPVKNSPRLYYHGACGYHWYLQFSNIESFNRTYFQSALPETVVNDLQAGKLKLLLHNYAEAFTDYVEALYNLLIVSFGIPEENIILLTEARDILPKIDRVASTLQKKSIRVVLTSDVESYVASKENQRKPMLGLHRDIGQKKFVNLNRRWRPQRMAFVALLKIHGLLDKGYVSLSSVEEGSWSTMWDAMIRMNVGLKDLFLSHKESIINMPPLTVDSLNLAVDPDWYQADHEMIQIHLDSYFSVVSETNFYNSESRFLTEKTFKTVCYRHPFLLLSAPFSLEYFKEKGYKPFAPWIDERYDHEVDDSKRMLMVLNETKRIANLTHQELIEFREQTDRICEHNYQVLTSKKIFNVNLN